MFTNDPYDVLVIAHDHARHLRAEQAAERLRPAPRALRPLAALLRWVADRLDRAPLAHRPA
jgi:L-ascorbate metabolism protein UlaG (beta-lactamase superfamily)